MNALDHDVTSKGYQSFGNEAKNHNYTITLNKALIRQVVQTATVITYALIREHHFQQLLSERFKQTPFVNSYNRRKKKRLYT